MSQEIRPESTRGRYREFRPTTLAVKNAVSVMVMLGIIVILGIVSYGRIAKEAQPEIKIPIIQVGTSYPGVAPKDMETLVTRVVEEKLNTLADIKELSSTSVEGYSSVIAEFHTDMDMEEALQKVRERVDLAKPELPADANDPAIREFNLAEFPMMQVNIAGEYSLVRLKDIAEELKDRLDRIPSILEVRISGGLEREVKVDVDLAKLKFYNLAYQDVVDAIRGENVTIPGGAIDVGAQKFLVRVDGEIRDMRVLEDVVVTTRAGAPVYVRDVAAVDFGFKERESYARLDGRSVVTLDVVKRSGENIIATSDAVKAEVEAMRPNFPPTTQVEITSDMSREIHNIVVSLENNIISGLILVLAVLLFFLGVRNASLVAISIPLSMLLSFIVIKGIGFSMNMVVLFSLILALGMLVDNAIVVVENIYRYREEGHTNLTSAIRGTGEVAMPIIASTLTTLGAFLPLAFWPGIVGEFMKYLPITLIITLSSSLFVALLIIPVLAVKFLRLEGERRPPMPRSGRLALLGVAALALLGVASGSPLAAVLLLATAAGLVVLHRKVLSRVAHWAQERALPVAVSRYEARLRWALAHRGLVVLAAVGLFFGTMFAFGAFNRGVEFFPESIPPSTVYVQVEVPSGTNTAFTNQVTEQLEAQLKEIPGIADAQSVVATAGKGAGNEFMGVSGDATIAVNFVDFDERSTDVFETLALMQERIGRGVAGADVKVIKPANGPPSGKPVNIEIAGDDPEVLRQIGEQIVARLRAAPVGGRLEGLSSDMTQGRPELVVDVDRERAALYGLSTAQVGSTVRSAIQGTEAAKYRVGNDEYDIVVRLAEAYRSDLDALQDLTVMHEGRPIPLTSVASWRTDEGAASVIRKDMDRVVTVSSDVRAGLNSNAVLAEVQRTLEGLDGTLPVGYRVRYTGQQQDQDEASEFLSGAFLVALLLIGFILVTQFNSVVKPVIILTSVVMSTVGVLLGLLVFQMPFGIIMTGVGVISLAGVVVNNAIVMIDYIDVLRERDGMSRREAIVQGGKTRFRPVVLTAVTTILGLAPLAIGFNIDFLGLFTALAPNVYWGGEQAAWWGPMAIAVICGLAFATFLTLVLVPVMYSLVDDASVWFARTFTPASGPEESVATGGAVEEEPSAERPAVPVAAGAGRELVALREAPVFRGGLQTHGF
jgi:multidrug efflux pump